MVIDVKKCSACGGDHNRVQTIELANPIPAPRPGKKAKRFFYCPVNGRQVFVAQKVKPDASPAAD